MFTSGQWRHDGHVTRKYKRRHVTARVAAQSADKSAHYAPAKSSRVRRDSRRPTDRPTDMGAGMSVVESRIRGGTPEGHAAEAAAAAAWWSEPPLDIHRSSNTHTHTHTQHAASLLSKGSTPGGRCDDIWGRNDFSFSSSVRGLELWHFWLSDKKAIRTVKLSRTSNS